MCKGELDVVVVEHQTPNREVLGSKKIGSGYFAGPGKIAPRSYFAGPGKIVHRSYFAVSGKIAI